MLEGESESKKASHITTRPAMEKTRRGDQVMNALPLRKSISMKN